MLAAALDDCAPAALSDDGLTLAWPETSSFLKRKAEDPANRDLLVKAIRSVTGTSLRLAYELRSESDPVPAIGGHGRRGAEAVRGGSRAAIHGGVRRGGAPSRPRGADLMPQPPNLQKMLAEAQAMLAQQQEAQEKLKEQKVEASAGGGMVKVAMTGDMRLESLTIDPDAVDPEDVEMLQDMLTAAINEALRMAEELQQSQLGGAEAGGFDPMSALESLGLGGMGGLGGGGGGGGAPGGPPGGAPNRAARRAQKRK